jgi:sugar phosphate isomerase/epimerase
MFPSFNARALGLALSADETLVLAAKAGFLGVDLLLRDLRQEGVDPATLRAKMRDLGLRAGAFPLPMNWRGNANAFQRDLGELPGLAAYAAALGLRRTGTWVLPETFRSIEQTFDMHVDRLGAIARVLEPHGIRLGLEVVGVASSRTGKGVPFVSRLAGLDPLLTALQARVSNVGILADSFHLYAAGESVEEAVRRGVEQVVWVHVADLPASSSPDRTAIQDTERGLPGEHGAVASEALLQAIYALGYDGPVTAEPMAGCLSLRGLNSREMSCRVADALRSVWPVEWTGRP